MSLFWRVFAANAAVMVAGLLTLILTPVSVSRTVTGTEAAVLVGGTAVLLAVNLLLLRSALSPLTRLAQRMQQLDLLQGTARVAPQGAGEVAMLEDAFNEMIDRLEEERRQAASRRLVAQEAERERIARELHDEIGQTMTGVLFQLNRVAAVAGDGVRPELAEAQAAVRTTLEDIRKIAQELRPETLDHLGLPRALRSLSTRFEQRTGLRIRLDLAEDLPPLPSETELALYRVAQESLTNVARHADASAVDVSLRADRARGRVVLCIADDGRGFDTSTAAGGGLRGIRERAMIVAGQVAIGTSAEGGAEIRLEVPA
jgi:two-component system, NarL family, sensor histidine kinase UhpB